MFTSKSPGHRLWHLILTLLILAYRKKIIIIVIIKVASDKQMNTEKWRRGRVEEQSSDWLSSSSCVASIVSLLMQLLMVLMVKDESEIQLGIKYHSFSAKSYPPLHLFSLFFHFQNMRCGQHQLTSHQTKCVRESFNWHSLSTSPFPLLFVCAAQGRTLPWHLSAFLFRCFILWPFCTLWLCRYKFLSYSRFYGWLCG